MGRNLDLEMALLGRDLGIVTCKGIEVGRNLGIVKALLGRDLGIFWALHGQWGGCGIWAL